MRQLPSRGHDPVGIDRLASPFTAATGSVADPEFVAAHVRNVDAVVHAATLHKPHVASHGRAAFVETNITGTLNLLEAAVAASVSRLIFISTTSVFGRAMAPGPGEPAVWITESVVPRVRNIYGATKTAAEDLCELVHADHGLPCLILRTSRFFPEGDDLAAVRVAYPDLNIKVNELLHRRVDIADVVDAVALALDRAPEIGFGRYIISATTPLTPDDLVAARADLPALVRRRHPEYEAVYAERRWRMFDSIDRVYSNERARRELGWTPRHSFAAALEALAAGKDPRSELARTIGAKGYHAVSTGVYTVR